MNVPPILCNEPCVVGIDEAGRGPVIGPMVYAAAVWPISMAEEFEKIGAKDSKTLTFEQRKAILTEMMAKKEFGYSYKLLEAEYISSSMLSKAKYNLNNISHDTVIDILNELIAEGVNIKAVYIDTVGDPDKYRTKVQSRLTKPMEVVVSKKADSLFPIVSAASIVAKVNRDATINEEWGSGYPADPNTVKYLNSCSDKVFGFPKHVRFSWATCTRLMEDKCFNVVYEMPKKRALKKEGLLNALGIAKV